MKRNAILVLFMLVFIQGTGFAQTPTDANWRALVQDAFGKSDLVVQGTIESVRDETERDGGHVYELRITGRHKGPDLQRVSLRAGGYFYTMPMAVDESILIFLKTSDPRTRGKQGPEYSVIEVDTLRPMVFRTEQGKASPVDQRLQPDFSGVAAGQVDEMLRSLRQ